MNDLTNLPPTCSVERAAELLGVSDKTIYRAIESGEIEVTRIGRRIRVLTPPLVRRLGYDAAGREDHGR